MAPLHRRLLGALLAAAVAAIPCRGLAQEAEHASAAGSTDAELRARYERVAALPGHEAAEHALAHARQALREAARARREGRADAAERSLAIAGAALVLAETLASRQGAHVALENARRRLREAEARATTAREALSRALTERARVLAAGEATEGAAADPGEEE